VTCSRPASCGRPSANKRTGRLHLASLTTPCRTPPRLRRRSPAVLRLPRGCTPPFLGAPHAALNFLFWALEQVGCGAVTVRPRQTMSLPDGAAANPATITVLHRGTKHSVALSGSVGELRAAIEASTNVPAAAQVLLCAGRKIAPPVADETLLTEFKICAGAKIMLGSVPTSAAGRIGGGLKVDASVAKVRAIDKTVAGVEGEVRELTARVERLKLGFLDEEKTASMAERIRTECARAEERLMRCLLSADGLAGGDATSLQGDKADAQWRAERKTLVARVQAALRRCDDDVHAPLTALVADEHDEMKHRRGGPT
jgi:hypothetical protein